MDNRFTIKFDANVGMFHFYHARENYYHHIELIVFWQLFNWFTSDRFIDFEDYIPKQIVNQEIW